MVEKAQICNLFALDILSEMLDLSLWSSHKFPLICMSHWQVGCSEILKKVQWLKWLVNKKTTPPQMYHTKLSYKFRRFGIQRNSCLKEQKAMKITGFPIYINKSLQSLKNEKSDWSRKLYYWIYIIGFFKERSCARAFWTYLMYCFKHKPGQFRHTYSIFHFFTVCK